jgi:hypothetical protein
MPIDARFRHTLTISRWTTTGSTDSGGHAVRAYVDDADTIAGNVQERAAREVTTGELEGVALSDAIGFLPIVSSTTSLKAPDRLKKSGLVYQLVGLPRDAGGRGRHLEADLVRVTP